MRPKFYLGQYVQKNSLTFIKSGGVNSNKKIGIDDLHRYGAISPSHDPKDRTGRIGGNQPAAQLRELDCGKF